MCGQSSLSFTDFALTGCGVLRGRGSQRPEGVRPSPAWRVGARAAQPCYSGLVRVSQDISIYWSGGGGGKDLEEGEGAAGEEGGKRELEVPWK